MSLLFGAGLSSTETIESGRLVLYCLIFQIFVTVYPGTLISAFIYLRLMQ
jgi:hypothetical protein